MARHIAVTLWVVGFFDIPGIGRIFFPRPDKNLSIPINEDQWKFSFQYTRCIFSFYGHSCIVNGVIFEDDTWFLFLLNRYIFYLSSIEFLRRA